MSRLALFYLMSLFLTMSFNNANGQLCTEPCPDSTNCLVPCKYCIVPVFPPWKICWNVPEITCDGQKKLLDVYNRTMKIPDFAIKGYFDLCDKERMKKRY